MNKVYRMNIDGKRRGIIATSSWRKAAQAAGIAVSRARDYGSVTANPTDVAIANSFPNVLFISEGDHRNFVAVIAK